MESREIVCPCNTSENNIPMGFKMCLLQYHSWWGDFGFCTLKFIVLFIGVDDRVQKLELLSHPVNHAL